MLINYFLMLQALLLFSGLALDAGLLELRKIQLQNAADSAAQEGMYEMGRGNNSWSSAGQAQAAQNGFANGINAVTVAVSSPPTAGPYSGDTLAVQATVTQTVTTLFMGLANGGQATLTGRAVARTLPTCIWVLNPGGMSQPAIKLSSSSLQPACGIYVNSSTPNLGVDYFSHLSSTRTRVVGPSTGNSSSGSVSPAPKFGAAPKNDPLAYITAPVFSSCNVTNVAVNGGSYTVYPGTYCGVSLTNATVTFYPGLYIITGGFSITNSVLTGSGVTIYLTQGGGFGYGTVNLSSSNLSLSAPTSSSAGGITGILMFGDRGWVARGSQSVSINNCTVAEDGIWYFPNTGMSVSSSNFSGPHYMGLVVDNFYQYGGNTYGSADYSSLLGGSPFHYEDGALVQ